MESLREILMQRYLDKTITTEELETLINVTEDGLAAEDELFLEMQIELRIRKTHTKEDLDHVANNLFYDRGEKEKATVPMYRSGRYIWWSAAAAIVVALGLGWYVQVFRDIDTPVASNERIPTTLIRVSSPNGAKYVVLPDSSTVLLNKGSQLSYSRTYGKEMREVFLIGEAFFDVKHDPAHKFLVRSGRITTTVLGTAFNVKQFNSEVIVTVSRGKVAVKDDVQEFGTITKNEQFTVNTERSICTRTNVKEGIAEAWTSQFIIINNETFERAVEQIEAKFKVKIAVENKELLKCKVTSAFLEEPKLEDVLTVISTLANASWTMKDGSVTIQGGGCN